MKKFFIIAVFLVAMMAAGCGEKISDRESGMMGGWKIVRSPLSGSCYEAYDYGPGNQRVFSLGKEVKCPPPDQLK